MRTLQKILAAIALAAVVIIVGYFDLRLQPAPQPKQSFAGTFTPAQIPQTTLSGAGVTSSASTVQLVSFATRDGRVVTMPMLGSTGYATLEPGSSKEEIISFTGVTQNSNGTATLTGVSRGLDFISPYAASTTLSKAHAGGAIFIISNTSPFYGQQFALVNNPSTIAAIWTFGSTTNPRLDADLATWVGQPAGAFASKGYVDSVVTGGAANGDYSTKGIFQAARPIQAASSTTLGSTGATLVLTAQIATSTFYLATSSVVVTQGDGKINPNAIATSSNYVYNWGSIMNFNGTTTVSGRSLITAGTSLTDASTINVDWGAGNTQTVVIAATGRTVTFTDLAVGESLKLLVCQDASGSRTITTWPSSIRWATGFAPTLTTTGGKCDTVSFFIATSTTSVFGAITQNF